MATITTQVDAAEVAAKIAALQKAGANLTPVWQTVGNTIVQRVRLGFRSSRAPDGSAWLPIKFRAPRTKKSGKLTRTGVLQAAANASGKAGQPLVDTGRLRRSIVAQASATDVVVGTNVLYAPVHQFGATIVPKNAPRLVFPGPNGDLLFVRKVTIPARPFMPLDPAGNINLPAQWSQSIVRVLQAHFAKVAA